MRRNMKNTPKADAQVYEIRLQGHLATRWVMWFEGMTITPEENGDTLLRGSVADQAALHGLLKRVRDIGVPLLAVNRVPCNRVVPN